MSACHSEVMFPQNRGRTTKKEKGSPQIREVYVHSPNQHAGEVKLKVDAMPKDLDYCFERQGVKKWAEWGKASSISRINIHEFSGIKVS